MTLQEMLSWIISRNVYIWYFLQATMTVMMMMMAFARRKRRL